VATFVATKAFGILHGLLDLLVTLARVSRLLTRRTIPAGLTSRCTSLLRRLESSHHVEVSVSRLGQESGSLLDSVLDALVVGPFFLVLGLRLLLSLNIKTPEIQGCGKTPESQGCEPGVLREAKSIQFLRGVSQGCFEK